MYIYNDELCELLNINKNEKYEKEKIYEMICEREEEGICIINKTIGIYIITNKIIKYEVEKVKMKKENIIRYIERSIKGDIDERYYIKTDIEIEEDIDKYEDIKISCI